MPSLEAVDRITFNVETLVVRDGQKLARPRPDADGYYTSFPVAALGAATRNLTYYDVDEFVKQIVSPDTYFNKMLTDGTLYGEYGHPSIADLPHAAQLSRLSVVAEERISHHFRKVSTGDKLESGGRLVVADVKPVGQFGAVLKESLEEPYINTAFSLRAITADRMEGSLRRRKMRKLVTFDAVAASGYAEATKRFCTQNTGSVEMLQIQIDPERDLACIESAALESFSKTELAEIFKTDQIAQVRREVTVLRGTGLLQAGEAGVRSLYHELVKGQ